jgi:hypothetical protein
MNLRINYQCAFGMTRLRETRPENTSAGFMQTPVGHIAFKCTAHTSSAIVPASTLPLKQKGSCPRQRMWQVSTFFRVSDTLAHRSNADHQQKNTSAGSRSRFFSLLRRRTVAIECSCGSAIRIGLRHVLFFVQGTRPNSKAAAKFRDCRRRDGY